MLGPVALDEHFDLLFIIPLENMWSVAVILK